MIATTKMLRQALQAAKKTMARQELLKEIWKRGEVSQRKRDLGRRELPGPGSDPKA